MSRHPEDLRVTANTHPLTTVFIIALDVTQVTQNIAEFINKFPQDSVLNYCQPFHKRRYRRHQTTLKTLYFKTLRELARGNYDY